MASDFVPTRIVHFPCPAFEPKYDSAYRQVRETGYYVPRKRSRKSRPAICRTCGTGLALKGGPLGYCESCSLHTLELQIKGPPSEKRKAPAKFQPKLSNREKRRARLAGRP